MGGLDDGSEYEVKVISRSPLGSGEDGPGQRVFTFGLGECIVLACLSTCLSILSVRLSFCLSDCLSVCLCVCLSVCLSVSLSVCLSVCLCVCVCQSSRSRCI